MKKILAILIFILTSLSIIRCVQKREGDQSEVDNTNTSPGEAQDTTRLSAIDFVEQGKALIDMSDCKTCHHIQNKTIGPGYNEIANKYEFIRPNVFMLADKIINGGSGVWGDMAMSPHHDISKDDAQKMAMYILSLDGESLKEQ